MVTYFNLLQQNVLLAFSHLSSRKQKHYRKKKVQKYCSIGLVLVWKRPILRQQRWKDLVCLFFNIYIFS